MDWIKDLLDQTGKSINDFLYQLSDSVYNGLIFLMQEMVKLLRKFPLISDTPEIYDVWKIMLYISCTFISFIIVYLAFKNICSISNITKSIEMKVVFGRLLYTLALIIGSLTFVDWLITFNNLLVDFFMETFDVQNSLQYMASDNITSNLVAACLIIYQMYLALKIMIGFWMRVAELNLMVVVSPIIFVLWINPNWNSYLPEWTRRIVSLIFTQFIQVLLMVLYGKMVYRFYESGSISSLCLAAAFLILMTNTPSFFDRFVAKDNAAKIVTQTGKSIFNKSRSAANKINSIKKKVFSK